METSTSSCLVPADDAIRQAGLQCPVWLADDLIRQLSLRGAQEGSVQRGDHQCVARRQYSLNYAPRVYATSIRNSTLVLTVQST